MSYGPILPGGGPVISCNAVLNNAGVNSSFEERRPYYGHLNDAGDDYLGFRALITFVATAVDGATLDVYMQQLGALITDLTSDQIATLGAIGGLSTDATKVYIQRLDTPGYAIVAATDELSAVADPITFATKTWETGTSGVTLSAGTITLAAGVYAVTAVLSIDAFWG